MKCIFDILCRYICGYVAVPTRRGDIEILAYNMVQWMGCMLPWENKSPETEVQNSKKKYMDDINLFLSTCFGNNKIPGNF